MKDFKQYLKDKIIKDCVMNEDGFYVWWPEKQSGYISEEAALIMYTVLKELNKDYTEELNSYFSKEN